MVQEWQAYETLEPFGERGAWHRAGMLAAVLVNLAPKRKGASKQGVKEERFMPKFDAVLKGRSRLTAAAVRELFSSLRRDQDRALPRPYKEPH